MPDHCQSETSAAARPGAVALVEAFEDARQVFGSDADPGVAHTDRHGTLRQPCRHLDRAAGRSEFDSVVEKIDDHSRQPFGVADDRRQVSSNVDGQAQPLLLRLPLQSLNGVGHDRSHLHRLLRHGEFP